MNLSIIIVTWNTALITKECVESINKYFKDLEIIVVDNGSTDNTVELLSKYQNVIVVKNGSNLGFSKANNIGLKYATKDYLLFLNSDMKLIDKSLEKMYFYLVKNANIGVIGPKLLNPDLTPQASVFPRQNIGNAIKEFYLGVKNSYSKYLPDGNDPQKVWSISGGCLMTKKTFFESIGSWNEKYFFYFEDMDLCRKVNKVGKDVFYYPLSQIIHHHGASGTKLTSFENQWRRLIPGSKLYHGILKHYLINWVIWSSQKIKKILFINN